MKLGHNYSSILGHTISQHASVCIQLSVMMVPWGRLKWSHAITRLTAHFMYGLTSDQICKFRKNMVIHDTNVLTETRCHQKQHKPKCGNVQTIDLMYLKRWWWISIVLSCSNRLNTESPISGVSKVAVAESWLFPCSGPSVLQSVCSFHSISGPGSTNRGHPTLYISLVK